MDELGGIPSRNENQSDSQGRVSAAALAREVVERHRHGLNARRQIGLTHEKYAMHLDGEGDAQWADLYESERLAIPQPFPGMVRRQENLLRPVIDNAVAYHTTQPLRFLVEPKPGRDAAARAMVDQAVVNSGSRRGDWNLAATEAMYLAMVAGSCPIHQFARDDVASGTYEFDPTGDPIGGAGGQQGVSRIRIDPFVGDPWDTVYNSGARRGSIHRMTYGRTLPLQVVIDAWGHIPGVDQLQGTTRSPSASRMQRIQRQWLVQGLGAHGSAALRAGRNSDPLISVVYEETAPTRQNPQGTINIVILDGVSSVESSEGGGSMGQALLVHHGALPAGVFSSEPIYSHQRLDDVYGKPFIGDLSDLQVQLNIALSMRAELIRRQLRPPLVTHGLISEDTAVYEDDAQLEVDPGSQFEPYYLQVKVEIQALTQDIEDLRSAIYTIGGWQAASRGESNAGDSGAKVVALARADDTVHGPTNQRFAKSMCGVASIYHALFRAYADIPMLVSATGDEFAHLVEAYVDRSMVSQDSPQFSVVSGYGATIETKGNQLLQLVQSQGADGEPLMTTRQFQKAWPDRSTYPEAEDPTEVRERRAKVINGKIRRLAGEMEQQLGEMAVQPQSLMMMHAAMLSEEPVYADDDPLAHFDALSSIIQNPQESKVAVELARMRQAAYQVWLQTGMGPPPVSPQAMMGQAAPSQQSGPEASAPAPQQAPMQMSVADPGGSQSAEAIRPTSGEMQGLTADAQRGQL